MPSNRFVFTGLDELKAQLRALPADLTDEAGAIIDHRAELAKSAVVQGYPPGDLRDGVYVTHHDSRGRFSAGATVVTAGKHAWLYDNGSEARHYTTAKGNRHDTGAMWGRTPPTHLFVGTMMRHRRAMYEELRALLTRHGLTVTGDGG